MSISSDETTKFDNLKSQYEDFKKIMLELSNMKNHSDLKVFDLAVRAEYFLLNHIENASFPTSKIGMIFLRLINDVDNYSIIGGNIVNEFYCTVQSFKQTPVDLELSIKNTIDNLKLLRTRCKLLLMQAKELVQKEQAEDNFMQKLQERMTQKLLCKSVEELISMLENEVKATDDKVKNHIALIKYIFNDDTFLN